MTDDDFDHRTLRCAWVLAALALAACAADTSGNHGRKLPEAGASADAGGTGGAGDGFGGSGAGNIVDGGQAPVDLDSSQMDANTGECTVENPCGCLTIGVIGRSPANWGSSGVFRSWINLQGSNLVDLADSELTPEVLKSVNILIGLSLDARNHGDSNIPDQKGIHYPGVYTPQGGYTAAEVQALNDWVKAGGGFIALSGWWGDQDEVSNVNALLEPFGMKFVLPLILDAAMTRPVPIPVKEFPNPHPTIKDVTAIGFDNGYAVQHDASSKVVARGTDAKGTYDLLVTKEVGMGKVAVWGDEWVIYDSEWSRGGFQVQKFWENTLSWLSFKSKCTVVIPPDLLE